jgi:hypothetical protein
VRITPLKRHAELHLPKLTDLFTDSLDVTEITVVSGGTTTLTCSAAHGVTLASQIGVTIVDAETPNPITDATVNADGSVKLTTQYAHDLSTTPDASRFNSWHTSAKLDGFDDGSIWDGTRQLVSVEDRNNFTVFAGVGVLSVTLDGGERLLERLERELVGWKRVTAATETTLTFPTPASVTRDYTVTTPVVVRNHRILGASHPDEILEKMSKTSDTEMSMWITPVDAKTSRSKASKTDAIADINDGSDYRQVLLDGFEIYVAIPLKNTVKGVAASDLCNGDVLNAVLKTFMGLRLPMPELFAGGNHVALLESHGRAGGDNAVYYHRYRFQAASIITNEDAIAPYDWADIDPADVETVPDSLPPVGVPAFHDIDIDDNGEADGIYRYGEPSPLTATIKLDDQQ